MTGIWKLGPPHTFKCSSEMTADTNTLWGLRAGRPSRVYKSEICSVSFHYEIPPITLCINLTCSISTSQSSRAVILLSCWAVAVLLTCSLGINRFIYNTVLLDCPCLDIHFPTHWRLMRCQWQLSLITQPQFNILPLNWLDKSAAISYFWAFRVAIAGLSLAGREGQGKLSSCITSPDKSR